MEINELKELLEILKDSGVNEFEMEREGVKLKITRGNINNIGSHAIPPQFSSVTMPAASLHHTPNSVETQATEKKVEAAPVETEDLHVITSPIVGTFYRCPNPTADPYADIGDRVKPGQTLCIVEAMKLMNEITSDVAGEIIKIFVENAQPVEYGEPLFAIKT